MAGKNLGPFWNQDTVTAAGLAFAGMTVLQSKLFPVLAVGAENSVTRLLDWKVLEWWPVLLILGGAAVWLRHIHQSRSRRTPVSVTQMGGRIERREQS